MSDGKCDLFSAATSQTLCLAFPVVLSPITCLFSDLYLCSQLLPMGGNPVLTSLPVLMKTLALGDVQGMEC